MAAPLRQVSVPAPGSQGLNSEISPFISAAEWALRADNAVVDRVGRLACREAFADYASQYDGLANEWDVVRLTRLETQASVQYADRTEWGTAEFSQAEYSAIGIRQKIANDMTFGLIGIKAGDPRSDLRKPVKGAMRTDYVLREESEYESYIAFEQDGDALVTIPEITPINGVSNCTLVPFKDSIYVFSKGEEVMVWDGEVAEPLSAKFNYSPPREDAGNLAEVINGDIACAAYGRLWVTGVNDDYQTIFYSDLLVPEQWYDGRSELEDDFNTGGIIDVAEYWPSGGDRIQGIAAHNGFLIVFGRESILIYSGAQGDPAGDPATGLGGMKLEDAIRDVGLVNQDAMCNIGSDHLFVDSLGVRSLGRVVQEKSSPLAEPSMNVATVIRPLIDEFRDSVRLFHMPSKSLVVCLFPALQEAYVFQLGQPSPTGGLKVTRWTGCDFYDGITVRTATTDTAILAARGSRGLTEYRGYTQPGTYYFKYESTVITPSDNLMQTLIPKSVSVSYIAELTPPVFNATWGFGSDMEYSRALRNPKGNAQFKTVTTSLNGTGEMMRIGFETSVDGNEVAVQQLSLNLMLGRIIV